jgi:hypothetical protein
MYTNLKIEIVGISPLIMHNGQTSDPLNKYARAMKEISGKRQKTEADFLEMARIEYIAGLYMDAEGPILPARMLEAVIGDGARKSKNGKLASAGVIVERNSRLDYDGPRDAESLFNDDRFRFAAPVRVGQAKIIRTRPRFDEWSATISVSYLPDIINEHDLKTAIRNAGSLCGLGDWRPRHGRFMLQEDISIAVPIAAE